MDIVIPFVNSVHPKDVELKYALRSLHTYLPDIGKVYIVGELPRFKFQNIEMVFNKQYTGKQDKQLNILRNISKVVDKVSEDFLIFHDDNFLLKPWEFKYYHKGKFWNGAGDYAITEQNTINVFCQDQYDIIYNYDIHCPHVVNREKFMKLGKLDWSVPHGYCIKTAYAILNGIVGEFQADVKIKVRMSEEQIRNEIQGRKFFSTLDSAMWPPMIRVLDSLYPQPSPYEKESNF